MPRPLRVGVWWNGAGQAHPGTSAENGPEAGYAIRPSARRPRARATPLARSPASRCVHARCRRAVVVLGGRSPFRAARRDAPSFAGCVRAKRARVESKREPQACTADPCHLCRGVVSRRIGTTVATKKDLMDIYDSIGQAFRLVDGLWRFADGASENATASTPDVPVPIARLRLSFSVSLDEEHVELSVSSGGRVLYVGARPHHYLLLTLARQRLKDAVRGVPESEHGWLRTDS